MQIEISKKAAKAIARMDAVVKNRIWQGLNYIPKGDIVPLKGASGSYRLRIGHWRILFSYPAPHVILVEDIAPRGQIYKGV